jgi:hypothetical protein
MKRLGDLPKQTGCPGGRNQKPGLMKMSTAARLQVSAPEPAQSFGPAQ